MPRLSASAGTTTGSQGKGGDGMGWGSVSPPWGLSEGQGHPPRALCGQLGVLGVAQL